MKIKLFGERNSGTNFCNKLMRRNFEDIDVLGGTGKAILQHGWKHGRPDSKLLDKFNKNEIIYVFIIRNLDSWLNSMYHKPYHIKKKKKKYFQFITEVTEIRKHKIQEHPLMTDLFEKNKNLFELRYSKYLEYKKIFTTHNSVFVNLEYVQNNPEEFINILSVTFNLNKRNVFVPILKHTKTGKKKVQNETYKKYDLTEYDLEKYISKELEDEINNLNIKINKI